MINVWTLLLNGLIFFIQHLILPLFGDSVSQLAAIHFGQLMASNAGIVFELLYDMMGSVVNLTIFAIFFGMLLITFIFRVSISIYKFIKDLIPIIG